MRISGRTVREMFCGCTGTFFRSHHLDNSLPLPHLLQRTGAGEEAGLGTQPCRSVRNMTLFVIHTDVFPSLCVGYIWIWGYSAHMRSQVHRLERSRAGAMSGVVLCPLFPQWNPESQAFRARGTLEVQ